MNIFLVSSVVSRIASQVTNTWSLLPVLYVSASGWELGGIQYSPES